MNVGFLCALSVAGDAHSDLDFLFTSIEELQDSDKH